MTEPTTCTACGSSDIAVEGYDVECHACGEFYSLPTNSWRCDCGETIDRYRGQGDQSCPRCGQWFNAGGQRLRSDWMDNPAWRYDDVDDMEGFEQQMLAREQE